MSRFRDLVARTFGAQPSTPAPDEPVELVPWVSEFEGGAIVARLSTFRVDAYWSPLSPTAGLRSRNSSNGPVMVRFEDLEAAQRVLADSSPLDDVPN